jgi:hypothetical protein
METMRDLLELQIIADANQGDTTVLADLLERLDDKVIYGALGDEHRDKFPQFNVYEEFSFIDENGKALDDDYNEYRNEAGCCIYVKEADWCLFTMVGDYCCDNCGGGFTRNEMVFDVNDQDLCKNCSNIK